MRNTRRLLIVSSLLVLLGAASGRAADVPVFIFAGQSNAVGTTTNVNDLSPAQRATQPHVLYYGPTEAGTTWAPMTPPTEGGNGFGPEISAAKTISDGLGGAQVAAVKFAVGGTNLYSQWNPANAGGLYDQMIARVQQSLTDLHTQTGLTGKVAGFFWMQGESDADPVHGPQYGANLTNFIQTLRANPVIDNPTLPFVFGQIIDYAPPDSTIVRQQQSLVAASVANTSFVLTDDLPHGDFIHFNSAGSYTLGERFGAGYLSLVPEPASLGSIVLVLPFLARRRRAAA